VKQDQASSGPAHPLHMTRIELAGDADVDVPGFINSVRLCLAALGVRARASFLMGISAAAFQFYYSSTDRTGGAQHYPQDPLRYIGKAFGLRVLCESPESLNEGMTRIRSVIDEGIPVIVPLVLPPPTWAAVVGYDEDTERLLVRNERGGQTFITYDEFAKRWSARLCPPLEPGSSRGRYVLYVLRRGASSPALREKAVRTALLVGSRMMKDRRSGSYAAGFEAYRKLIADLRAEAHGAGSTVAQRRALSAWFDRPLFHLRTARTAASVFLDEVADDLGSGAWAAQAASGEYRRISDLLRRVRESAPSAADLNSADPVARRKAQQEFAADCATCADLLSKVLSTEKSAVSHLGEALHGA